MVHSHDNTEVLSSCFPFERFKVSFFSSGKHQIEQVQLSLRDKPFECQLQTYQISLSFRFWFQQDHPVLLLVNVLFTYHLNIAERAVSDSKIYEIPKIQSENENHLAVPYDLVLLTEQQWISCSFRKIKHRIICTHIKKCFFKICRFSPMLLAKIYLTAIIAIVLYSWGDWVSAVL